MIVSGFHLIKRLREVLNLPECVTKLVIVAEPNDVARVYVCGAVTADDAKVGGLVDAVGGIVVERVKDVVIGERGEVEVVADAVEYVPFAEEVGEPLEVSAK